MSANTETTAADVDRQHRDHDPEAEHHEEGDATEDEDLATERLTSNGSRSAWATEREPDHGSQGIGAISRSSPCR
jgi:hypothetical protein